MRVGREGRLSPSFLFAWFLQLRIQSVTNSVDCADERVLPGRINFFSDAPYAGVKSVKRNLGIRLPAASHQCVRAKYLIRMAHEEFEQRVLHRLQDNFGPVFHCLTSHGVQSDVACVEGSAFQLCGSAKQSSQSRGKLLRMKRLGQIETVK